MLLSGFVPNFRGTIAVCCSFLVGCIFQGLFFFMFKGSKFVDNVSKLLINIRMNFGLRAGSPRVLGWGLKENPYLYIILGA